MAVEIHGVMARNTAKPVKVTAKQFLEYERIRQSGVTNMFDVYTVIELSDGVLDRTICGNIMRHYSFLKKKYLKV